MGAAGTTFAGSHIWTQDYAGILGNAAAGDEFAFSLATGWFKGNGRTDLAVGAPTRRVAAVERRQHRHQGNFVYVLSVRRSSRMTCRAVLGRALPGHVPPR